MHVSDLPDEFIPPERAPSAGEDPTPETLGNGLSVLVEAVQNLTQKPGVYRMLNAKGEALYVGKAKNLKKRVTSYTRMDRMPLRLQRMVFQTHTFASVSSQ